LRQMLSGALHVARRLTPPSDFARLIERHAAPYSAFLSAVVALRRLDGTAAIDLVRRLLDAYFTPIA